MNEGRQNSVTRRGLIRGSALGAAGIGALAAPVLFGSAPASAAVAPGLSWNNVHTDFQADNTGQSDATQDRIIGPTTGQGSRNNRFSKLTFEFPSGGMIKLESTTGDIIEDVTLEDLVKYPAGNPMISIATAAGNTSGCAGITIRNYARRGGATSAITDIQLDANAAQILIDMPSVYSGGPQLVIDAGSATNVTLLGSPGAGNYTLRNGSGVKVLS